MSLHSVDADAYDENGAPIVKRTWQPVDLADVLDGSWSTPEATVGARSDGVGLFYPGKAHTVSSESEGGKTWLALSAAQDEIRRGRHVLYVDFEDDAGPIVSRLMALGCPPAAIAAQFHYVRPESPIGELPGRVDLTDVLATYRPSLGIIDGVTEGMVVHGLDPLSNRDAATFGRLLPRLIKAHGAAVVSLDHVTKSSEGRGRYAIGAVHKLNGLDGAAYVLEARKAAGVGLVGRSTVRIAKDRPGQLRKHALPSSGGLHWFADVVLDATTDGLADIDVEAPEAHGPTSTEARPTHLMAKISGALADKGPLSQRQILALVGGKRDYAIKALTFLTIDGYVTEKTPHQLIRPYSEDGSK